MKKLISLLILASFYISCNSSEETQIIKIDGRYALEIPASMQKTEDLNDEASLQYQHLMNELYIIVIDEPKSQLETALEYGSLYDRYTNDLDGYARLITDNMKTSLGPDDSIPNPKNLKINGLDAKLFSFEGTTQGVDIFWELAFIEGNSRYYQVMAWTLASSREKNGGKMKAMINSFRETDKSIKQ